jgi:transcriptional regulator with XRE-family HTH domain
MEARRAIARARERAGLTLRTLASRAETSHSTLSAYETGRVAPTLDTFARVIAAAGFEPVISLERRVDSDERRSRELVDVLELAAQFPARRSPAIEFPVFGRAGS